MAQTRKRRRRKHRGTQAGRIDTRARGRPRSRQEAKARARSKRSAPRSRGPKPPSWRSAINRGLIASALVIVVGLLFFGNPLGAIAFGLVLLGPYILITYWIDAFFWRRAELRKLREKA